VLRKAVKRLLPTFVVLAASCGGGGGGASLPASSSNAGTLSSTPAPGGAPGAAPGGGVVAAPGTGVVAAPGAGTVAAPAATPTVKPATAPTGSPAPIILSAGGCGPSPSFVNGVDYTATWAPYNCATSPWNERVSALPTYASYSSSEISVEFGNGNSQGVLEEEAGAYDYGHPVYYASGNDPLVNISCTQYCNRVDNGGFPATMHIPAKARPALGGDAHMAVIQPDGTEIDTWATTQPGGNWTSGGTVTAHAVANCGNFVSGSGFTPTGPAATAGGACVGAGLLRANELLAGSINHALFLVAQCTNGSQYPAFSGASTNPCTGGSGLPLGGRLWYDVPDATTNANSSLRPWEKAVLNALHDYGGYLEDDVGGASAVSGIAFKAESSEPPYANGLSDPFAALSSQGWTAITVAGALTLRYIGADQWNPPGVNFAAHMHWLDACSAHGSC
jgi:hypothetical protein